MKELRFKTYQEYRDYENNRRRPYATAYREKNRERLRAYNTQWMRNYRAKLKAEKLIQKNDQSQ